MPSYACVAVHSADTIIAMFITDRATGWRHATTRADTVACLVTAALAALWSAGCLACAWLLTLAGEFAIFHSALEFWWTH